MQPSSCTRPPLGHSSTPKWLACCVGRRDDLAGQTGGRIQRPGAGNPFPTAAPQGTDRQKGARPAPTVAIASREMLPALWPGLFSHVVTDAPPPLRSAHRTALRQHVSNWAAGPSNRRLSFVGASGQLLFQVKPPPYKGRKKDCADHSSTEDELSRG